MDIRCTQNIFRSAEGQTAISYYIFRPVGVPLRGIVQISHGMCEYFSRYTMFAKYLCSLGFMVCGNDHLGHGSSVSPTGALGFFGQNDGWHVLVEDTAKLMETVKKRYPDLPYFLLGHAMGAMVVRLYLAEYGGEHLDGCILCDMPATNSSASLGIYLSDSVIRSHGPMYRSSMLNNMLFRKYNARIPNCRTPFDWLTRDTKVVSLYQSDAKCNFIFTAAGFRDLFCMMKKCSSLRCVRESPKDVPLLFLAGDADPAGAYGSGVKKTATAYRAAGNRNVDVIFYKDCRHELLNELNREEVFGDISRWLEQQLPAEQNPNVQ